VADAWVQKFRQRKDAKRERKRQKYSPNHTARAAPPPEVRRPLCPLDLSDDLVTVSVPTFNTPIKLLERAVASILRGSHRHVRVVVISDGERGRPSWEGLSKDLRADARLICVASPTNFGPYFNHDVVARAASGPWFAVQDSDDVSGHRRLQRQLGALHRQRAEGVHSPIFQHDRGGGRQLLRGSNEASAAWTHRANHFGLYSRNVLLAFGGYHGGFRVGYDTNLVLFWNLLAKTRLTKDALYTRHKRPESLTRAAATGHGSPLRTRHKRDLKIMWGEVYSATQQSRRHGLDRCRAMATRGARRRGDLRLREKLVEETRAALGQIDLELPPLHPAQLDRVAAATSDPKLAVEVYRYCEQKRPGRVLEVGTGLVTAALGVYAARYGATVTSVHYQSQHLDARRTALRGLGLLDALEVRQVAHGEAGYDLGREPFDLVLVAEGSRTSVEKVAHSGSEVWLPGPEGDAALGVSGSPRSLTSGGRRLLVR
jgi:glycosyltransferase involved in cell wall biosynthesis